MRPPICDVCGDDFDPSEGALVSCQPTEAVSSSVERPEMPGTVGHPPNQGWFCPRHVELAERLAPTTTLQRLSHVARRNDDTQTCEVCGERFDKRTVGGMCSFQSTQAGRDFHMARIRNEDVGLHPDMAWICHAHIDPALRIKALTKAAAIAELTPPGRAPYAYDERPPSTPPDLDEYSPPIRGPFRPVADDGLDDATEQTFVVGPRPVERSEKLIRNSLSTIGELFGAGRLRNGGNAGSHVDTPTSAWVPPDVVAALGWAPHQVADTTLFDGGYTFRRGERTGPVIGGTAVLLIQRRQRSIFEASFLPAVPPSLGADGVLLIERVVVRKAAELDPALVESLDAVVEGWVADLEAVPIDPLDPSPDLVDVDLGTGRIARINSPDGGSRIEWAAGGSLARVKQAMTDRLPDLLSALGVDTEVELESTTRRNWSPMDGATPPNCPYSDEWRWQGASPGVEVTIWATSAHWHDHSVSNTSANLWISIDGERALRLWFHQRLDSDDHTPTLSLDRPTTPTVVATVRDVFDC